MKPPTSTCTKKPTKSTENETKKLNEAQEATNHVGLNLTPLAGVRLQNTANQTLLRGDQKTLQEKTHNQVNEISNFKR
jgi:hypothetical protein